ncbi:MAG: DUF983 domain-containing protein [Actinomycetota bacterium]|nr:DUF983 domain-containing protein [Actinomycetota bacterium]
MSHRGRGAGDPGLGTLLWRGLRRRCPVCGSKGIFRSWGQLSERCPTCGYSFVREEGYWVSAIIVNTAVIEAVFGLVFVVILIATAPDVAWVPLLTVGLVGNLLIPILFYPRSKTLWMAIDLFFHPREASER